MNKKSKDKVFLVHDDAHGIGYAVTVPEKTTELGCRHIANTILIAGKEWYKVPIDQRNKMHHDSLKFIVKFLELSKIKNTVVQELG